MKSDSSYTEYPAFANRDTLSARKVNDPNAVSCTINLVWERSPDELEAESSSNGIVSDADACKS